MNSKTKLSVATMVVALACALTAGEVAAQTITVAPASPTIAVGQTQQFTATGVGTATAIDMGAFHSCARFQDGTVRCWGNNVSGQLGDGTQTDSSMPVAVVGITGAAAVTGGGFHTCARFPDGTLQCWGRNNAGQLGDPATLREAVTTPVRVTGITTATAVSAGGFHTCALPGDGTVRCWGQNDYGQLGNGTSDPVPDSPSTFNPTPVTVSGITTAVAISAGGWYTCALLQNGTIRCWGDNTYGQLGDGATIAPPTVRIASTPVTVSGITTAVAIDAGIFHVCALLQDGSARCWGRNGDGRLGNGSTANSSTPTAVPGVNPVALGAGAEHACAVLGDGTVRCWGDNNWGQLGNGSPEGTTSTIPAAPATGITTAIATSAGAEHNCVLLRDGTVRCWGNNNFGRVGVGTTAAGTRPCLNSPSCAFSPVAVDGIGGVVWTSSDTTVATIDANGLATARGPGSTTITAASGGRSGSTVLTVATRPTLSVVREGTGGGTVRSGDGRIVCGATCAADYASGSSATLTATADPGSTFEGWRGGGCAGTGACTVTLSASTTVFASFGVFRPATFTLTVTVNNAGTGSGTVTSNDGGINNCGTSCSASYDSGTPVTLTARPATGSIFTGWSGCDAVSGTTCTVTMNAARSVTASFARQRFTLTVAVNNVGTGSGTVTSNDGGINNCGASCSASYDSGTPVTLTARPATGSIFTGWSGCDTVSGTTCTVTMNAARSVTAIFAPQTFTLSVTRQGNGTVTSISPDGRIDCGSACSASYNSGTVVTLRATPGLLYAFAGWSGGGCSGTGDCVVTLRANTTVTARFSFLGLF
ncbi:MAG: hypothetical protein DMD96_12750 [Candidatus Rokuibacteriota bacterium]|nr:MAG: hypothetical protein DMD96_12750 [Candidatus Rokubacteria bacterium]